MEGIEIMMMIKYYFRGKDCYKGTVVCPTCKKEYELDTTAKELFDNPNNCVECFIKQNNSSFNGKKIIMPETFKITNLKGIEIIIDDNGAISGLEAIWPKDDAMIIVNKIPQLKLEAEEKGYREGYDAGLGDGVEET